MNNPIISFLMCARIRTDLNNPNVRDIYKFFRDAIDVIYPYDRSKVEFLIKFDSDDTYAKKIVNQLKDFPFIIRPFFYNRCEGMYSAHNNYTYLLCRVNPNSKFIGFCGDDSVFNHFSESNISQMEELLNNKYVLLVNKPEMTQIKNLLSYSNYKFSGTIDKIMNANLVEPYPIVSRKILEITGGCGYHYNIDTWLGLLNLILVHKYNISIAKNNRRQTFLRDNTQIKDIIRDDWHITENGVYKGYRSNWNQDMENIPYYIDLVEQQAKSIYLHMISDGVLDEYKI